MRLLLICTLLVLALLISHTAYLSIIFNKHNSVVRICKLAYLYCYNHKKCFDLLINVSVF